MELPKTDWCAPLKQLMAEHSKLRIDMETFYEGIEEVGFQSGPEVTRLFADLYEQVAAFTVALEAHSRREEEGLFPIMARRLGENDRTIEVMEFEHEKAEQHLREFLSEAEQAGANVSEDDAQSIAVHAEQAYATLTQHFAKEEKNLFPLAEALLTAAEKEELERLMRR
jgi:hemerythrin-like domain-containing protein